jgi:hypothetical protein
MSIVIVSGLFLVVSLAQWRVCWVSSSVCGRAYPFPIHLCWNIVPIDPNILSLVNGEDNCLREVGHVIGEEKCECAIWNESIMCSRMAFGSVYWESLRGVIF